MMAALKASVAKKDLKLTELKDRAEIAEQELEIRDEASIEASNDATVKRLQEHITKQRDEVKNKGKAATAG